MRFSSSAEKAVMLWYTFAHLMRSKLLHFFAGRLATGQNASIKVQIVFILLIIIRRGQKMHPWLVVYVRQWRAQSAEQAARICDSWREGVIPLVRGESGHGRQTRLEQLRQTVGYVLAQYLVRQFVEDLLVEKIGP